MGQEVKEFRGIENLVVAEVIKDASDEITFGAVEKLAGVAELSKESESSSETHYYDNAPLIVINSQGSDTVTIQASVLSLEMVAKITGRKYDATKGMLVEVKGEAAPYAVSHGKIEEGFSIIGQTCNIYSYPRYDVKIERKMMSDSAASCSDIPNVDEYNAPDF